MPERSESGNGDARPSYLDSLVASVVGEDYRLVDWNQTHPYLRTFLLGEGKALSDTGTGFRVCAGQRGLCVTVATTRYGYQARYDDVNLESILETLNNDLDCGTVPWEPDWRRKRENSKRLEL